jgi:hypothetical protein
MRSLMPWKANDKSFLLILVLDLEATWIILYDHDKMLRHQSCIGLCRVLYLVGP